MKDIVDRIARVSKEMETKALFDQAGWNMQTMKLNAAPKEYHEALATMKPKP